MFLKICHLWFCVLDADAQADAHSDAQSDADERSHVPKFPRSDNHDIDKFLGRFARPPYLAEFKKYYVFLLQR